jgi:hypothetical protein
MGTMRAPPFWVPKIPAVMAVIRFQKSAISASVMIAPSLLFPGQTRLRGFRSGRSV